MILQKLRASSSNIFIFIWLLLHEWYCRMESVDIKSNSGRAKIVGTVVCVGGAMVLTLYKGMPLFDRPQSQTTVSIPQAMELSIKLSYSKKAERWTIGCVALIVGTLLWSSWFLLQSNIGKRYPCQYSSTAIMSFFGAIQSAILCLSTERNFSIWVLKGKLEIITVLYAVCTYFPFPFQLFTIKNWAFYDRISVEKKKH